MNSIGTQPPSISAVTTAVPGHRLHQDEVKEEVRRVFHTLPDVNRLVRLFDRCGVEWRHLAHPKEYYLTSRSFRERNESYISIAMQLGESAIRKALATANLAAKDVDLFVFVTTTGLATPSLDARLSRKLEMRESVRRVPLFGLGCAGGAGAIAMAADYLQHHPDHTAVVLSVELCSLTWTLEEVSKVNLVGISLFADGAGCMVLTGANRPSPGPTVRATRSILFPNTEALMGWNFSENGFELVLSPGVPGFIAEAFPEKARDFLTSEGTDSESVDHFALHPGGRQVLEAYRRGLGLDPEALAPTREALRKNGNLSSASVFFSLRELLDTTQPREGETGFMAAMGPGFATEMLLLAW